MATETATTTAGRNSAAHSSGVSPSTAQRLFPFHIGRRRSPTSPTFDDAISGSRGGRRASFSSPVPPSPTSGSIPTSSSVPLNSVLESTTPSTTTPTTPTNDRSVRPFVAAMLRRSTNSNRPQQSTTGNNNEAAQPHSPTSPTASSSFAPTPTATTTTTTAATAGGASDAPTTTTNPGGATALASASNNLPPEMPSSNSVSAPGGQSTTNGATGGAHAHNQQPSSQQQQGPQSSSSQLQNPSPLPGTVHRIRLVPHLESARSLPFEPIIRDAVEGGPPLRVGRFTDRQTAMASAPNAPNATKIAFRSKVVSRGHAEIWVESGGNFFLKDTKSSSGTFLNHIRLATANAESRPFPLKDGDIIQLGIDYQGGQQEIYRCVKIKVEIARDWQTLGNAFNANALRRLQAVGVSNVAPSGLLLGPASAIPGQLKGQLATAPPQPILPILPDSVLTAIATSNGQLTISPSQLQLTKTQIQHAHWNGLAHAARNAASEGGHKEDTAANATQDCCICLFPVTVCQALFVAPCSHAFHYKCMRPMLLSHHPGFQCPLCRTFADLESDVEVEGIDGYLNLAEGGVPMPSVMEEKSVTSVPAPSSLAPAVHHPARTPIPAVVELTDDNASELNRSSVIPELEPGTRASGSGSGSASGTPAGTGAGAAGAGAPGTAVGPTFFGAAAATPVSDSRIDDAGVLAAVSGYHPTYGHEGADFELDADAMGEAEEEEEVDELEEHEGDEMVTSEAEREAAASTYEPTHTRSVHARYAATPSTSSGTVRRQQRHARSAGTGNEDATFITGVVDDVELEEDPASSLAARRLRRAMGDDGDEEAEVEEEVRGGAGSQPRSQSLAVEDDYEDDEDEATAAREVTPQGAARNLAPHHDLMHIDEEVDPAYYADEFGARAAGGSSAAAVAMGRAGGSAAAGGASGSYGSATLVGGLFGGGDKRRRD